MWKTLGGFFFGVLAAAVVAWNSAGSFMFREIPSPFGMEETAARIQANIQKLAGKGWSLSGLRDPSRAVAAAGGNVLPVLLVEACSTEYSKPLLKDDDTRILSILMPCSITVYKKSDGKVYIGLMNSGLLGRLFGDKVAAVMAEVAKDQDEFVKFDPSTPAPPLIRTSPGGGGGGSGSEPSGC
jgi:uncharacterized protein (DUF302 family)